MNPNEYQERAMAMEADQEELLHYRTECGVTAVRFDNGLTGLVDEVGELSAVKKRWLEYQKPLTEEIRMNVLEECGDVLWRTSQILKAFGFTMEQAMAVNLAKLEEVRYKNTKCNPVDAAEENRDRAAEAEAMARKLKAEDDGVNYG